jgi:hypothetical protein
MWILLSIFPELSHEDDVIEIIGCFTDIRYVSFCVLTAGSMHVLSTSVQLLVGLQMSYSGF